MKWISLVLIVGVFIAHDTANWLATPQFSPGRVFYMLQGAWSALLSAVLMLFISMQRQSVWRDLALVALGISIIEGMEMPVCMLAVDSAKVPRGTNLCDYAAGFPIGYVIESLYFMAVVRILWRNRATRTP